MYSGFSFTVSDDCSSWRVADDWSFHLPFLEMVAVDWALVVSTIFEFYVKFLGGFKFEYFFIFHLQFLGLVADDWALVV